MDEQDLVEYDDLMVDSEDSLYYEDLDPEQLKELMLQYSQQDRMSAFLFNFKACLVPTTVQTAQVVAPLLLMCLVLRVISLSRVPRLISHFVSLAAGVVALFMFSKNSAVYPIVMCVLAYPVLFLKPGNKGPVMAAGCLTFLLTCELFVVEATAWHQVRGSQMILAMKLISLSFELDQGSVPNVPNPLEFGGYSLSVSSIIFGPFMTYHDYCQILKKNKLSFGWFVGVVRSLVLSYVCLVISTCISPLIFVEGSYKWFLAYQKALSFRFSHYFVSFLSEGTTLVSGIGTEVSQEGTQVTVWRGDVARPQHIEFPRSITEVVVHWNIPMHVFLKNYVFKKAIPLGRFTAVFLTFVASSLLHGLNFQLAAVLISIGTYAYIEHVLRQKMATIFDACIQARKCKAECKHTYKEGGFWVTAVNLAFTFLSMFHLAYLGIMFDGDSDIQEEGYSMTHTLRQWSDLDFASHWVALGSYLFYRIIA